MEFRKNSWFQGGCVTHSMPIIYVDGIGIVYTPEAVGSPRINSSSRTSHGALRRQHHLRGSAR